MANGVFITLEGIEGAGKSTLRSNLARLLSSIGREIVVTHEPGATPFGKQIRSMVLDPQNKDLDTIAELMLFQADRAQHIREVVRPALSRGAIVLCDRYIHSTLAYQGYGRGLDLETLMSISLFTTGNLLPNLTILLDLPPKTGLERATTRTRKSSGNFSLQEIQGTISSAPPPDRFEQQAISFHEKVRNGFLELSSDSRFSFAVLDGTLSQDALAEQAFRAVSSKLKP